MQIAKAFGAHVTAVTHPDTIELVRSIGADEVVDYTVTDFTRQGTRYDLIFDAGGNRSFRDCARAMTPDGVLVICGAPKGNWLAPILRPTMGALRSRVGSRTYAPFLSHRETDDLQALRELAEAGKLRPVIERTYSLAEVPEAMRRIETGRVRGKLVVTGVRLVQPLRQRQLEPGADAAIPALGLEHDLARRGPRRAPATRTARGPGPAAPATARRPFARNAGTGCRAPPAAGRCPRRGSRWWPDRRPAPRSGGCGRSAAST